MDIVTVTNLKKSYGDFTAVNGINFTIQQGEIFGLLGPNGAGKTSTINMMIGLSRPTSGSITINGKDIVKDTKNAQSIMGIVPDESNLYDEMNGFENLCFCASLYGMKKQEREQKAKQLLEQFHLIQAGNRPFKAYSKGMKRKLTIAAGIIHSPQILFLDEPTTGIDVESAIQIRELVLNLKKNGTTILLTTHYIEEAERICNRIAFIVGGRIVKTGTVNELMENIDKEYIVQFTVNESIDNLKQELEETFASCRIIINNKTLTISSKSRISLLPFVEYLDKKGIQVYEAKELHPSLEDVFVKVTGIESDKLKKEKEKGGTGK